MRNPNNMASWAAGVGLQVVVLLVLLPVAMGICGAQRPAGMPRVLLQQGGASNTSNARGSSSSSGSCPPYIDTQKYRTTNFTNYLNTTVAISPKRPSADVPTGDWISGRATFYGTDERVEASRVACGEPAGQFGILAQGSCGYTTSDGSLPFPRNMYAAAADSNEDYPGSCGRCYQVRLAGACIWGR
jgi:cullin-associated NEDD8-dissociated protein 1